MVRDEEAEAAGPYKVHVSGTISEVISSRGRLENHCMFKQSMMVRSKG